MTDNIHGLRRSRSAPNTPRFPRGDNSPRPAFPTIVPRSYVVRGARSRFLFLSRDYFRSPRAMRTRHRTAKSAAKGEARSRVNWSRTVAPLLAGYRRRVSAARDFDVRREIQHAREEWGGRGTGDGGRGRGGEERERDFSGGERADDGNGSTQITHRALDRERKGKRRRKGKKKKTRHVDLHSWRSSRSRGSSRVPARP